MVLIPPGFWDFRFLVSFDLRNSDFPMANMPTAPWYSTPVPQMDGPDPFRISRFSMSSEFFISKSRSSMPLLTSHVVWHVLNTATCHFDLLPTCAWVVESVWHLSLPGCATCFLLDMVCWHGSSRWSRSYIDLTVQVQLGFHSSRFQGLWCQWNLTFLTRDSWNSDG